MNVSATATVAPPAPAITSGDSKPPFILAVLIRGGDTYQSNIIVARNNPARDLLELRGYRFGSGDLNSTSGWLYPASCLIMHGPDPGAFFAEHVVTGSHDRSVQAVADGVIDAARLDDHLKNTCMLDPVGGSVSFYDTKVKLTKV